MIHGRYGGCFSTTLVVIGVGGQSGTGSCERNRRGEGRQRLLEGGPGGDSQYQEGHHGYCEQQHVPHEYYFLASRSIPPTLKLALACKEYARSEEHTSELQSHSFIS